MTQYRAARLPRHLGPAAWNDILGPQKAARVLDNEETADFVVIGAGFAGLSAACRLTQLQPGARIVVLEAGRVAEGAAGRNSGFMIDLPHDLTSQNYAGAGDDRVLTRLNRQAIAFGREAVAAYGIDPAFFDPAGKVNGAASSASLDHNAAYAAHLEKLGEPHERLDAQAMAELTGSDYYAGGLYTPGTVLLQPAGYMRGLAAGVGQAADIYEKSPVLAFARQGNDWLVQTAKGAVTTPRVILTTNGHLESFGVAKGALMHVFLFASMTPDLAEADLARLAGASRWGVTPSDPMGTTMRRIDPPLGGNRIVTRSGAVMRPGMVPTAADLSRARRTHQRKFDARFPQFAGMQMAYSWGGHLCLTLNGVAVMREIDRGVFSGCVQNGLGTARGTLTGIGAAEMACGEQSEITQYFCAEPEPKPLLPKPIATIGANAVMRWREWRARAE